MLSSLSLPSQHNILCFDSNNIHYEVYFADVNCYFDNIRLTTPPVFITNFVTCEFEAITYNDTRV